MTTLADIDSQPASTLACSHLTCKTCAVVDRDWERMRKGHVCSTCGTPGEGGRLYFPISIHILVDLIQQAFHSNVSTTPPRGPQGPDVGTVLYFCSLREALLNHFLVSALNAQKVPMALIERLLDDNKLAVQKFGGLFTSVTGAKWAVAVSQVSRSMSFRCVSELMVKAAGLRNTFLHEGSAWTITREVSTECINAVPNMVQLFVELHNEYIHRPAQSDA